MNITVIITQLIQLFLMLFLGYFLCKRGIFDRHTNQKMTKLCLTVTTPCLVLSSVLQQTGERNYSLIAFTFAIAIVYYIVMPFIGWLICKLLRLPRQSHGLYMFMAVFENIGFMGIPLINAIYGGEGVLYTAIFNICFNLAAFGYGPVMLNIGTCRTSKPDLKDVLSPGTILSVFTIVVYLSGFKLPGVLTGVISSVGAVTSPMAMMLTGAALALVDIRTVFTDRHVYPFLAVRQLIFPLIIFPLFALVIKDPVLLGVVFILTIMPCASNSVLFATNYNNDESLAARTVFISTLCSLITIPALVMFCLV